MFGFFRPASRALALVATLLLSFGCGDDSTGKDDKTSNNVANNGNNGTNNVSASNNASNNGGGTNNADNNPPVAVDDEVATRQGQAIVIEVLANDSDPDGDPLVISEVSNPRQGSIDSDGQTIGYAPNASFAGNDSFTYTIDDGRGGTATATVTINVNAVPIAQDDSAITLPNNPVQIDVLANDSDPDGDALAVTVVTDPMFGNALTNGMTVTYTPNQNYSGNDTFRYTVDDGRGGTAEATINVLVNGAPSAVDDAVMTNVDTPIVIDVLANDSDPEGHALTVLLVGQPSNGSAVTDGSTVTFTPSAGFGGTETFGYTVEDEFGATASANVTVVVNSAPVAVDDATFTLVDQPIDVAVLDNDSDPDGDMFSITAVTNGVSGTTAINGDLVTYTPGAAFEGTDSFTYTISDALGAMATASVTIDVVRPVAGIQLDSGDNHTCAVRADGTMVCWGAGLRGQLGNGARDDSPAPVQVGIVSDWESVSGGSGHTCAVRANGTLWCWGSGSDGETGQGMSSSSDVPVQVGSDGNWMAAAAGDRHSCALKDDGTIYCFGWNLDGQIGVGQSSLWIEMVSQVGNGTDWFAIAAGDDHSCGLKGAGELWCWGDNGSDQLGVPSVSSDADAPVRVGTGSNWTGVFLGGAHSCGLRAGELWCWGNGNSGAVGNGGTSDVATPTQIGSDTDWSNVALGGNHSCGVRAGMLFCWGSNRFGQLGDGTIADRTFPTRIGSDTDWASVSAGENFTCGRKTAGDLFCWGRNLNGALGGASVVDNTVPAQVGTGTDYDKITAGAYVFGINYSCAHRNGGELWCWGANGEGQLGVNSREASQHPLRVGTATDWTIFGPGGEHQCGIRSDDSLWCWGSNWLSMLGDGTSTDRLEPIRIGAGWQSVEGGRQHTCGVKTDGTMWCWGRNGQQQLADATLNESAVPLQVGVDTDWEMTAVGEFWSCGIKSGEAHCWGSSYAEVVTRVGTASDWAMLSGGGNRMCGLKTDSTIWCFPAGGSPSQVGMENDWDALSAFAEGHMCAIKDTGTLWCWGDNDDGQLGLGSTTDQPLPTQVGTETDWVSVATAGTVFGGHTCAVRGNGTAWCWGDDSYGQLGKDTAWVLSPQPVVP